MQENINSIERYHLLIPFPELIVPMNGVLVLSELILEEGRGQNNKTDELRDWVLKHSQIFDDWATKVRDIGNLNGNNSSSEEQSQRIVDALEGIEIVMAESKGVSKSVFKLATEKKLFDQLIGALSVLEKHYRKAQDFLNNKGQK